MTRSSRSQKSTVRKAAPRIARSVPTATVPAEKNSENTPVSDFPIIGIGASAGGLEALEQFFSNMPADSGMAFVVIQHQDPDHVGMMAELLQRTTTMNVVQAADQSTVQPNCVYIIPPNKSMSLLNGRLHLFDPVELRGFRLPIDVFFRSLAADRQENSVGIILSGMGSDGSLGLKAIKGQLGAVFVQDPASAKFDGMPRSAIEAVRPDSIASAEELPARLIEFLKEPAHAIEETVIGEKDSGTLDKIIILLRKQTGHDFSLYKKNTLFRRIERRKKVHQIESIEQYVRFLQENPKELEILFRELLIGVTNFFRDTAVWKKLKETILPAMLEPLPHGYVLRAWVPGCSTGEEAYSLAIVFKEALEDLETPKILTLQIFATDLDTDSIEIARKGAYPKSIAADISPERLSRYFTPDGERYRVNTSVREMVVFAPQNVMKDPPFTKLDILTCRNMLIYFEPVLQKKLIALFNYSLNPGGILVLGSAETIGGRTEGFEELDGKLKCYKRTQKPQLPELIDHPRTVHQFEKTPNVVVAMDSTVVNLQVLADQILLQRYAPASVLVNKDGDILYITGSTGKYLAPVAGKANWNIYVMAREGLREALPAAFRKAMKSYEAVVLRSVKVGTNGGTVFVDVTVQRIEKPDAIQGMAMVIFSDVPAVPEEQSVKDGGDEKPRSASRRKGLEKELQRSYEELQSTREEMQTSQEELKSTNEELQSTNEELQSTNEELTTSKEEMQSLNEEMQTMNSELQSKVSDFVQANNDMKNLLNSTEIATLFLDIDRNIRRYTDATTKIIKLRTADVGRPFTDLVSDLRYPEIDAHTQLVLQTLVTMEKAIETNDQRWYNVRIMPYRTMDNRIDGLVITFTDISEAKRIDIALKSANDRLTISEARYRRLFETSKDGILLLDPESGKITDLNPVMSEMLGYSREQFMEKAIWEIGFLKDIIANKEKFRELHQKEYVRYEDLPLETSDGRTINVEFISSVYSVNDIKHMQCQIRDITARKQAEEVLRKSREGTERTRTP